MKRGLLIVFAGIFVLPLLCESYMPIYAHIDKNHSDNYNTSGKYNHQSDSVSVDYDRHTGTIMISTASERKTVKIHIYKGGELIYEDKDDVFKSFSLGYTLTEEESGAYDVFVTVEDGDVIEGTIIK